MAATEHDQQAQLDNARASFIGFTFDDPKDAFAFKLKFAGNKHE